MGLQDPDGDAVSLTTTRVPEWATVSILPPGASALSLIELWGFPDSTDAVGTYVVGVRIQDPSGLAAEGSFELHLGHAGSCGGESPICSICISVPLPPVARAGGSYEGVAGRPVRFDGSGSSPGSEPSTYRWNFGDGTTALGQVVEHRYASGGTYRPVLTAFNRGGASRDTAVANVREGYSVRAFLANRPRPIVLAPSAAAIRIHLEPSENTYALEDIDAGSITLSAADGGESITSSSPKSQEVADSDRNGKPEITVLFSVEGLRRLFGEERGRRHVMAQVSGRLTAGTRLIGALELEVLGMPADKVFAWPNPMNPQGRIAFENPRQGRVRVSVFDIEGRLTRVLRNEVLPPGRIEVSFDGKNDHGMDLASGVYHYRIELGSVVRTGRLTILR
jgi:hypothetical protein